jgi:hypothetical protein
MDNSINGIIYCITNGITNKKYVGQTKSKKNIKGNIRIWTAEDRLREHKRNSCMKSVQYTVRKLYESMKQCGISHFTVETLKTCDIVDAGYWEQYYIKELQTQDDGYNTHKGGNVDTRLHHGKRKCIVTDELRARLSKTNNDHVNICECNRGGNLVGYRVRINYNGKLVEKRFTSTKFTVQDNYKKAEEFLTNIKTEQPIDVPFFNKTNSLPLNIYYKKDKGDIVGYNVSISVNKKAHTKTFRSKKLSLEDKYKLALEYKDKLIKQLNIKG